MDHETRKNEIYQDLFFFFKIEMKLSFLLKMTFTF